MHVAIVLQMGGDKYRPKIKTRKSGAAIGASFGNEETVMKRVGIKLWLGASVSALTLAAMTTGAYAQDAAPPVSGDPAAARPGDTAAAAADDTVVVVTARRKALQNATERKKNSDTIIDSVVADEAGKLPDNSITEVLQRVVGVSIVHSNLGDPNHFLVEGSGLQVRGLNGVMGLLNGREVFSANGGAGISWGEITPELMSAVDVYKASRADLIEGGTGGSIDLRTKMPFDYKKPETDVTLSYNYGDLVRKGTPGVSALTTRRFDTPVGEMGVLVDLAYSDLTSKDSFERVEPYTSEYNVALDKNVYVPSGFNYGDDVFERKRAGLYEAFQWKPNDNLQLYQTIFVSNYKSTSLGTEAQFGIMRPYADNKLQYPKADAKFDDNGVMVSGTQFVAGNPQTPGAYADWHPCYSAAPNGSSYGELASNVNWGPNNCVLGAFSGSSIRTYEKSDNTTADFSQGFIWRPSDKLRVRGALQYVDSLATKNGFGLALTSNSADFDSYHLDTTGSSPVFSINNGEQLLTTAPYVWQNIIYMNQKNHATMTAVNVDADYDLGDGFFKTLSVGARYADHIEHDVFSGTYWAPLAQTWAGYDSQYPISAPDKTADTELYDFSHFFNGAIALPSKVYMPSLSLLKTFDYNYVMDNYGYNRKDYTSPTQALFFNDPFNTSSTKVKTASIYLQTKFGSDPVGILPAFTGNIGIRISDYTVTSNGFDSTYLSQFYLSQAESDADLQANNGVATNYHYLPDAAKPVSGTNHYARALPSFNINFKPTDHVAVRFAASQTMSPPYYGDLKPSRSVSINTNANSSNTNTTIVTNPDGTVTTVPGKSYPNILTGFTLNLAGNPKLKPTMSTNYDASVEWYPDYTADVHINLFRKDLRNIISYQAVPGNTAEVTSYDRATNTPTTQTVTVTTRGNINVPGHGELVGIELGGRKFFDKWVIKGFGIEGNFTYIESNAPGAYATDMLGNRFKNVPLIGLSRYNANLTLLYSKDPWDIRLAYSWRNKFLQSTGANGTQGDYDLCTKADYATGCKHPDPNDTNVPPAMLNNRIQFGLPTYGDDYGSLDLGISYKINDRARVNFQANNLTNALYKTIMEITPGTFYTRSYYVSDRRASMTLLMNF